MTGRQTILPAGGRATFRSKALVLLGTLLILGSMLAIAAGRPGSAWAAGASSLDHFTVTASASASAPATAGSTVAVTITALDRRGRIVTDYAGPGSLGGLVDSPSGLQRQPSYSAISWSSGIGSANVTPKNSQIGATVTYTDTATTKTAFATFSVAPSLPTAIAFIAQPVDTLFDKPIFSSLATTTGVKVKATDAYGNPVNGVSVTVDDNDLDVTLAGTKTVATAGGDFGVSPFGEAAFTTLNLPTLGTYTLGAVGTYPIVNPSVTLTALASSSFEIVAAISTCTGASCKNTGDNDHDSEDHFPQKTYGTIKPSEGASSFSNNVVLTTQFADKGASQCTIGAGTDDLLVFGQTTEVRVQNTVPNAEGISGISATQPDFRVALLYPYETLQALDITSRGVPSFEVCLGATWLGAAGADETNAWQAKNISSGALEPAVEAGESGVYWGWVPDCAALTVEQKVTNPCFELRTKSASQLQSTLGLSKGDIKALEYKSGDLALVVWKPFPWDGKFTAR